MGKVVGISEAVGAIRMWAGTVCAILLFFGPAELGAVQMMQEELSQAVAMTRDAAVRMDSAGLILVRERLQPLTDSASTAAEAHHALALAEYVSLLTRDYSTLVRVREETESRLARADASLSEAIILAPERSRLRARATALRSLVLQLRANVRQGSGTASPDSVRSTSAEARRTMDEALLLAPDDLEVASAHVLLLLTTPSPDAQSEAMEALAELDERLRRSPDSDQGMRAGWLFLFARSMRVRQLVSAGDPKKALEVARETLILEPDFEPVRSLLPGVEARAVAQDLRFRPEDPARIVDLEWHEVARDPAGDGATDTLPDARVLQTATTPERLWLRVTLEGGVPRRRFGMNLALDADGDPSNGARWWGENSSFRWDRLFTVWLEAAEGGSYRGILGMGGPEGPADMNPANLHQGDLAFAFLADGLAMGIPWNLLPGSGEVRGVAAVGSHRSWNDDIPGSGSIGIPSSRTPS